MSDATNAFFERLAERGHDPRLRQASGTIRFDLVKGRETECRYLTIERGSLSVSKKRSLAGSVMRVDRAVFERLAAGELNPVAAVFRGELQVEGDWRLLVLVQRLFPGSPGAKGPRRSAGWARRQA